jgi:hypothetical protein
MHGKYYNAHRVFVGRPKCKLVDKVKPYIEETRCEVVDFFYLRVGFRDQFY